jgi:hypothetical protein
VDLESLDAATLTPTPRISQYVQGDEADDSGTQARHTTTPARARLYTRRLPVSLHTCSAAQIIVETNFRVYAYTTSYVDYQILSRFASIIEKFPDMCAVHARPRSATQPASNNLCMIVAEIDKRSAFMYVTLLLFTRTSRDTRCMAFDADISSELIIDYLILRSHPACASLKFAPHSSPPHPTPLPRHVTRAGSLCLSAWWTRCICGRRSGTAWCLPPALSSALLQATG